MKGSSFKASVIAAYIVATISIMGKNSENRVAVVWREAAFMPSYILNTLEIITSKGFEHIFLIYIFHS